MIDVVFSRGPYDIALAKVSPPYEFIGEFLTAEGSCTDSWACADLPRIVQDVMHGCKAAYERTGDANRIRITSSTVIIESLYRVPPATVSLSPVEFLDLLRQWQHLLEEHGYSGVD